MVTAAYLLFGSREQAARLEVELAASGVDSRTQVFFNTGHGYNESEKAEDDVHGGHRTQTLHFALPLGRGVQSVRYDPLTTAGSVTLRRAEIILEDGRTLQHFDLGRVTPLHEIERLELRPDGALTVVTTPGSNDSQLALPLDAPLWIPALTGTQRIQRLAGWEGVLIAFAATATLLWRHRNQWVPPVRTFVHRSGSVLEIVSTGTLRSDYTASGPAEYYIRLWLWLLVLGLTIFGARLWLIQVYGSELPILDQWSGEGQFLFKPWREGRLTWAAMVSPHNEHRIFFTRAWSLGLFCLNGEQWDSRVEMAANGLLFTGVVLGLVVAAQRALFAKSGWTAALFWSVAVFGGLPLAVENALWGFQSHFYFLLGFSLLALWGLGTRRAGTSGWWIGGFSAPAACFSGASGFFAALVVGAWICFTNVWSLRRRSRAFDSGSLVTLAVCVGVVTLGWAGRVEVPASAAFRAESLGAWVRAFGRALAWPRVEVSAWALVAYFPLMMLTGWWLLARARWKSREKAVEGLLLVGGWAMLQAAAIAYSRGGQNSVPAARYADLLALGAVVNAISVWLVARAWCDVAGPGRSWWALAVAGIWTGGLVAGAWHQTTEDFRLGLPGRRAYLRQAENNVRAYVVRGDRRGFDQSSPAVPYPVTSLLVELLDDPALRPVLPPVIRQPLGVKADDASGFTSENFPESLRASSPDDGPVWGSYGPRGVGDEGAFRGWMQPSHQPYLRWWFAGDLGSKGLALWAERKTAANGMELVATLQPRGNHFAGERWRSEHVRVQTGVELRLAAEDRSVQSWFGFAAPVEVGPLSYWTGWLLRRGEAVFWAGVFGLIVVTLGIMPRLFQAFLFRVSEEASTPRTEF